VRLGGLEDMRKARWLSRDDHGGFGLASIRPVASACLRIEVDDGSGASGTFCGDGQGKRKGGFAGSAFLGNDCNDIHSRLSFLG